MAINEYIYQNQDKANAYWVLGDFYNFKITGNETNGGFTIIEQIIQPNSGPPPHIHHREDEAFYVLDGKFSFLCGEKETIAKSGSFMYVPKGMLHTFKNINETQSRLLVVITPAGLENFFYAIGTPVGNSDNPPAFDPTILDKLMHLASEYQMDILLPEAK
jgi:mannose-6-phosphate isomerase-like protein (cupin superfamily)